jgi:hypothetical protein
MLSVNNTTRRHVMKGISATALTLCAADVAHCDVSGPTPADPFMDAYHTWCKSRSDWSRLANTSLNDSSNSDELDRIWEVGDEALEVMADTSPKSREGFAALAHVIFDYHGPSLDRRSDAYSKAVGYADIRLLLNLYGSLSGGRDLPDLSATF